MDRQDRGPEGDGPSSGADDGDAFGRLANATRLEILRALVLEDTPLSYGELFEQLTIDDRGQFNYHVRQLLDSYVLKSAEGYRLSQTGRRAGNVLVSNALTDGANRPFGRIDSRCGGCGADTVEIGYRDGEGVVRCPDCDRQLVRFDFPPAAVEGYSLETFAKAFARRTRAYFGLADDGFCPFCSHEVSTGIRPSAATRADDLPAVVDCTACSAGIRGPIGLFLLNRPRICAVLADAGAPLRETPFWEFGWCTFDSPTLQQADPLVAELTIEFGDESRSVLVDSALEILEIRHQS